MQSTSPSTIQGMALTQRETTERWLGLGQHATTTETRDGRLFIESQVDAVQRFTLTYLSVQSTINASKV